MSEIQLLSDIINAINDLRERVDKLECENIETTNSIYELDNRIEAFENGNVKT